MGENYLNNICIICSHMIYLSCQVSKILMNNRSIVHLTADGYWIREWAFAEKGSFSVCHFQSQLKCIYFNFIPR